MIKTVRDVSKNMKNWLQLSGNIRELVSNSCHSVPYEASEIFSEHELKPQTHVNVKEIRSINAMLPIVSPSSEGVQLIHDIHDMSNVEMAYFTAYNDLSADNLSAISHSLHDNNCRTYLQSTFNHIKNSIAASIEGLCIQALNGVIEYPYEKGGNNLCISLGKVPSLSTIDISKMDMNSLQNMFYSFLQPLKKYGFGGKNVVFYAGNSVYHAILLKCNALMTGGSAFIAPSANGIRLFGVYELRLSTASYCMPGTKKYVSWIKPDEICVVDRDASHVKYFGSIANIHANMQAMELYIDAQEINGGKALRVSGETRMLPIPSMNALVKIRFTGI